MPAAVSMMLTAVGLLVGLGIYVYLGARAEVALLRQRARAGEVGATAIQRRRWLIAPICRATRFAKS